MKSITTVKLAAGLLFTLTTTAASALDVQPLLDAGEFKQAQNQLEQQLAQAPDNGDARLALGVTTFLAGIEEFAQTMHQYGLRDLSEFGMALPILSLPVRRNPDPQTVSADDVVAMLERFEQALAQVDDILEPLGDQPAHMPLRIGTVRMDLNADGQLTDDESLHRFFTAITQPRRRWQPQPSPEEQAAIAAQANQFVLGLDTADAYWLRGYCHVMSGLTDLVLAYDGTELFERTGQIFFEKTQTPYAFLQEEPRRDFNLQTGLDAVALLHLIDQPLRDADRMPAARQHFLTVIELSRKSWNSIRAETDNQNEWVPGPNQTGVIGINLTAEQIDAWMGFLDETQAILNGDKLLPFWRGTNPDRGINLKRVFEEPTRLDLILWVQGTAAAPYLEEGELTERNFWDRLNRDFGRNFPGFALWIN